MQFITISALLVVEVIGLLDKQVVSVNPAAQVQVYLFTSLSHVAPFLHGDDAQLSITK